MLATVSGVRAQCTAASGAQRCGAIAPVGPFSQRRCTVSGVSRTLRFASIRTHAVDGGVIDKPVTSEKVKQSNSTLGKKPPIYKVMLHNDNFNRREYVVKVLLKVVDGLHVDDAVNVMQEAHINGIALVIACGQDKAEEYVESLRLNGLVSTLEPGR